MPKSKPPRKAVVESSSEEESDKEVTEDATKSKDATKTSISKDTPISKKRTKVVRSHKQPIAKKLKWTLRKRPDNLQSFDMANCYDEDSSDDSSYSEKDGGDSSDSSDSSSSSSSDSSSSDSSDSSSSSSDSSGDESEKDSAGYNLFKAMMTKKHADQKELKRKEETITLWIRDIPVGKKPKVRAVAERVYDKIYALPTQADILQSKMPFGEKCALIEKINILNETEENTEEYLLRKEAIFKRIDTYNRISNTEKELEDAEEESNKLIAVDATPMKMRILQANISQRNRLVLLQKLLLLDKIPVGDDNYSKLYEWMEWVLKIVSRPYPLKIAMTDGELAVNRFIWNAKEVLDRKLYGMNKAKERLLEILASRIRNPGTKNMALALCGPPGVGKCLHPNTQVLLYFGGMKAAKNIAQGDILMGDDSKPRIVMNASSGVDTMYKITPTVGDAFVTNSCHVLTLYNETTAEIVDIPLDQYLANQSHQHKYKLFSKSVEYPSKPVKNDPYLVGVLLGSKSTTVDDVVKEYLHRKLDNIASFVSSADKLLFETSSIDQTEIAYLLNHRYVPDEYLYNTRAIRHRLLLGYCDSVKQSYLLESQASTRNGSRGNSQTGSRTGSRSNSQNGSRIGTRSSSVTSSRITSRAVSQRSSRSSSQRNSRSTSPTGISTTVHNPANTPVGTLSSRIDIDDFAYTVDGPSGLVTTAMPVKSLASTVIPTSTRTIVTPIVRNRGTLVMKSTKPSSRSTTPTSTTKSTTPTSTTKSTTPTSTTKSTTNISQAAAKARLPAISKIPTLVSTAASTAASTATSTSTSTRSSRLDQFKKSTKPVLNSKLTNLKIRDVILAEQVKFLVRSLGFECYFIADQITINSDITILPRISTINATGFTVEQLAAGDYCGFTIDGNGRFMLASCMVTHNTELISAFSEAVDQPFAKINMGGSTDPAYFLGHSYTYQGSMPGVLTRAMTNLMASDGKLSSSGVLFFDEFDKIGLDSKIGHVFLHASDPVQQKTFQDQYMPEIDIDLSGITFVYSMNVKANIDAVLLNRMPVVHVDGYKYDEKKIICKKHIIPKELKNNGFAPDDVTFADDAIGDIITNTLKEDSDGMRKIAEKVQIIIRKINALSCTTCSDGKKIFSYTLKNFKIPYVVTRETLAELKIFDDNGASASYEHIFL